MARGAECLLRPNAAFTESYCSNTSSRSTASHDGGMVGGGGGWWVSGRTPSTHRIGAEGAPLAPEGGKVGVKGQRRGARLLRALAVNTIPAEKKTPGRIGVAAPVQRGRNGHCSHGRTHTHTHTTRSPAPAQRLSLGRSFPGSLPIRTTTHPASDVSLFQHAQRSRVRGWFLCPGHPSVSPGRAGWTC